MIYGSMVDYYLEPKIAHYFLRRAYEPVLVSFEKTPDRICVWVVNDSPQPCPERWWCSGWISPARPWANSRPRSPSSRAKPSDASTPRRWARSACAASSSTRRFAGREATCLLIGERYLHLPQAHLTARLADGRIEIATDAFARQVTLEFDGVTGAVFEDNFFDLIPGQKRTIAVLKAAGGAALTVRALNAEPVTIPWKP